MKKFFIFVLLILILAAAMTGLTACSKADEPQDAFMGWISQVSAENMRWVFVEAWQNDENVLFELDEIQKEAFAAVLETVENGQAEQIPFTDESQQATFTLTLHEEAEDGGDDKCTFTGIGDNTLILRFGSDVPLGAEGLWQLENPQLYEHISALAEDYRKAEEAKRQEEEDKQAAEAEKENQKYSRITLDVAASMKNISVENIVQIEPVYNVTAAELAKALNGAAKNLIDDKAALDKGFEPDKFTVWDIDYVQFKEFSKEINEEIYLSLDLSCDFEEHIVMATVRYGTNSATAFFDDEELYNLVRFGRDFEEVINKAAFKKFEDILIAQMERCLEAYSDNPGQFTSYELTKFVLSDTVMEADGAEVELYDFDFALVPEKVENIGWVGGMRLDGKCRVVQHNFQGPLAVRCRNGKVTATSFLGYDYAAEADEYTSKWMKYMLDEDETN